MARAATFYNWPCLCLPPRGDAGNFVTHGGFLALRLLHFADLHLDRSFAGQRLFGVAAQRRREDLRAALQRIVERAQRDQCDLITCGGDLFEQESVTRETAFFAAQTLGSAGRPVLIAPGEGDPAVPSSPYRWLRWPSNVTIATHEELRPYRFGEVQVWTAGFTRPDVSESPLRGFSGTGGGVSLLLLHGSDMSAVPEGAVPCAPIVASQVEDCGFQHALLGHYHQPSTGPRLTYPGSPEPLGWSETGRHGVALVTVSAEGAVEVSLEDINQRRFLQETIDISGMTHREHVRDALFAIKEAKGLDGSVLRVTLVGERSRSLELDPQALLLECGDSFAHLEFADESRLPHDLAAAAAEFTSRGEMVRLLLDRGKRAGEGDETVRRALQLALDAFEA